MEHPCGALPVHYISATVYWCSHHQAWWVNVCEVSDDGGEATYEHFLTEQFGPFDTPHDVHQWASRHLEALMVEVDRPWSSPPAT